MSTSSSDDPFAQVRSRFAPRWEPRVRCGEGWAPLLVELDRAIAAVSPATEYIHIKEKHAQLIVLVSPPANAEVRELIDAAAAKAQSTCENCGAAGVPHEKFGWVHVLCPRCAARDGYSPK
ncbi:MAG: hypothetical protein KDB26_13980 [Microthrixaceae bacterium]|nr:hypothetical protein [Microthrixaceae bacterium]